MPGSKIRRKKNGDVNKGTAYTIVDLANNKQILAHTRKCVHVEKRKMHRITWLDEWNKYTHTRAHCTHKKRVMLHLNWIVN